MESHFDVDTTRPLADYSIVCVQHILGSTGSLIASLVRCGADPSRIHVVGKAYSTHQGVYEQLRRCRVEVTNPAFEGGADEPYDAVLARAVSRCLLRVVHRCRRLGSRRILLIDDGGHALASANALTDEFHICAVEQTTRGIRVASTLSPRFPVVNVGRSRAKLELEAPLIALSMTRSLDHLLGSAKDLFGAVEDVMLVGYGAVGRAVAIRLRERRLRLAIFDERPEARLLAVEDGFATVEDLNASLGRCLVATSTGAVSFPPRLHALLEPGSILASMGSSDLEFAAWQLRESASVRGLFDIAGRELERRGQRPPWETHYLLADHGRNTVLMKGGFPIDFDGSPDPIPPAAIQLTRSLLLTAALQATGETRAGLVDLDAVFQNELAGEYGRLQGD